MAIGLYQQVVGQVIAADLSLGRMYLEGRGVEQDFELARKHLNVVLDARISGIDEMQAEAMQLIASFTEESPLQQAQHVLKNARDYSIDQINEQIRKIDSFLHMDEAKQLFFKLFLLNAQKGEASSQYQVGYWYLNGLYTEKNLEEAVYWIQKAADQKDQYAECKIGYLYEKGLYFNADLSFNVRIRRILKRRCFD
jgi:TPR repeat protein